jgi:hypothetical protein
MKNKNVIYDLVRYNLVILLLFVAGFFIHGYIMVSSNLQVPFSVLSIYLFFAIASSVIISGVLLLKDILPNQIGYFFLMAIFLKLGVFLLVFSSEIFTEHPLNMPANLSLITPLFIFLIFEGIVLAKQLKLLFK